MLETMGRGGPEQASPSHKLPPLEIRVPSESPRLPGGALML